MVTVALVIRVAIPVALRLVVLRECRNNIHRPYSTVLYILAESLCTVQ
jgi:hypothetical protein